MQVIKFILNNESISTDANPGMVLLDFIRKRKNLTGTKEGCREGDCGACTILAGELTDGKVKYKSINSCLYPLGNVDNKHIVTIEGINTDSLSPIQKYFVEEGASQCGFCTPGFIISLTGYLLNNKKYNFDEAINAIAGNICRCTGYSSIKRSVNKIFDNFTIKYSEDKNRLQDLIDFNLLPEYFLQIESRLKEIVSTSEKPVLTENVEKNYVGGGTDLYVQIPEELLDKELSFVSQGGKHLILVDEGTCTLSGDITFEEFKKSTLLNKYFIGLAESLNLIASLPIRNSATIAGNIVNASPIGDMTIFLLALNAQLELQKNGTLREILLKDFFKGYKSLNKDPEEKVKSISFSVPGKDSFFSFEKVSKRTYLDIASVNSAIMLKINNNKISNAELSAGGVAPIPLYLTSASVYLKDKEISEETIKELLQIVDDEISPISDVRGSDEYKRLLLKQLIKAHFIKLFPDQIKIEMLT